MKTLPLILERAEGGGWYGRIENVKHFMPVTFGADVAEVEDNLRELIKNHQEYDAADDWAKIDVNKISFDRYFDLAGLFEKFDVLKISSVAQRAGMNASLLRQYVGGKKYPSLAQSKRIEDAIRQIATELAGVSVYA